MKKFFKEHKWQSIAVSLMIMIAILGSTLSVNLERQGNHIMPIVSVGSAVSASTTADYIATGTAAQQTATFQTALNALPSTGGILNILSGTFTFNATVTRAVNNVTIEGIGSSTIFQNNGSTPIFTVGGTGWNFENFATDAGGISAGSYTDYVSNVSFNGTLAATSGGNVSSNITAPTGRTAYSIAAYDSPAIEKQQADYVMPNASADIGAVMNAALAAGDYNIHLDYGHFCLSSTITIHNLNSVTVNGEGMGNVAASGLNTDMYGTIIWLASGSSCDMVDVTNAVTYSNVNFSNLCLDGNKFYGGIGTTGVLLKGFQNYWTNVLVQFQDGIGITYTTPSQGEVMTNVWVCAVTTEGWQINASCYDDTWYNCYVSVVSTTGGCAWNCNAGFGDLQWYNCQTDNIPTNGWSIYALSYGGAACVVQDCIFNTETGSGNLYMQGTIGWRVDNNTFQDYTNVSYGILYDDYGNVHTNDVISENYFVGGARGIDLEGSGGSTVSNCLISNNTFSGQSSAAIFYTVYAKPGFTIINNIGADPIGKITNPIGAATIGLGGSGTSVASGTVYVVSGCDCMITSTGGTVTNIVIKDPAGNTMETGATTLTNQLVFRGYSVTWTHTGAPTVTVYGN